MNVALIVDVIVTLIVAYFISLKVFEELSKTSARLKRLISICTFIVITLVFSIPTFFLNKIKNSEPPIDGPENNWGRGWPDYKLRAEADVSLQTLLNKLNKSKEDSVSFKRMKNGKFNQKSMSKTGKDSLNRLIKQNKEELDSLRLDSIRLEGACSDAYHMRK